MRWEQLEDPACGRDEVIVRARACGLNHSDLDSRAGSSRWPFTMPWVLGAEFAGTVVAVGAEVAGIADGDPVTAYQQFACGTCTACGRWRPDLCERFVVFGTDRWGGYAELVAVPARAVIPLRSPDDFVTAAAAQCVVSTAWSMVVSVAAVRAGETVLVPSASGGVAGAAVQAARLSGARVIASVGAPEKADAVRALGADVVFCYRDTPVAEAVAEATGGRGVDAVIDTTGGPRFGEHMAAMAAHAGEVVPFDIVELFRHGHRILGFRVATPDEIRRSLAMALDGAITVPVDRTFPTAEAAAAHAYMDERKHVGKIVLVSE
jgi:NADPH:quinone reductase-like Zn-dependent oxidoreductase